MWVVFGLSYEKTPHSKLELHNRLEPAFVSPIVEENFPRSAPTKGKRKNIFQVHEKSEDNDIVIDQHSSKKLKVFKPTISSTANPTSSNILYRFTSLKIKTKICQITQCYHDKDSYELILNDLILNILNVNKKIDSCLQYFH